MVRGFHDDRATELLRAYLRHVDEATSGSGSARDEIVIVLPERAGVVDQRTDGRATEIRLRIEPVS